VEVERDWFYAHNAARAYSAHLGGSMSKRQIFSSKAEAVTWLKERAR
jgi:hypothetical protein